MKTDITKADIEACLSAMAKRFDEELFSMSQDELSESFLFKWKNNLSVEWNVYRFFDLLDLHKRRCRRWEEHHNGSSCVVERVRDKYLMPRIKEFITRFTHDLPSTAQPNSSEGE